MGDELSPSPTTTELLTQLEKLEEQWHDWISRMASKISTMDGANVGTGINVGSIQDSQTVQDFLHNTVLSLLVSEKPANDDQHQKETKDT